jgi:DNA-binding transcriptional regulator YhcF (GntR family)
MNTDSQAEIAAQNPVPDAQHSLSEQVYHLLVTKIEAGEFQVGDYLPSKRDLAAQFGFSTNPVHRALRKLEEEGYICRIHGSGVRVQSLAPVRRSARRFPIIDFIASIPNLQEQTELKSKKEQVIFVAMEQWLWWHLSRAPGIRVTLSTLASASKDSTFLSRLQEAEELRPAVLVFCLPEEFSDKEAAILHRLKTRGTRVVYHAARREESGIDRVYSDFATGQYQLTRYLLKKGFRRILRFTTGRSHLFEKLKQEGFLRALREAGYTEQEAEKWTLPAQYTPDTYTALLRQLKESGEPVGIMAHCDPHVFYIRIALKSLNVTQAEVTGYDATWSETNWKEPFLYKNWPSLHPELAGPGNEPASVDTQLPLVGKALAELVLGRAHNTLPPEPQVRWVAQKMTLPQP